MGFKNAFLPILDLETFYLEKEETVNTFKIYCSKITNLRRAITVFGHKFIHYGYPTKILVLKIVVDLLTTHYKEVEAFFIKIINFILKELNYPLLEEIKVVFSSK